MDCLGRVSVAIGVVDENCIRPSPRAVRRHYNRQPFLDEMPGLDLIRYLTPNSFPDELERGDDGMRRLVATVLDLEADDQLAGFGHGVRSYGE
ncbi:MAG: hypothetical protein ACRDH5_03635 [bacterium]